MRVEVFDRGYESGGVNAQRLGESTEVRCRGDQSFDVGLTGSSDAEPVA